MPSETSSEERINAYEEFFKDLANEEELSDESIKPTKKDGYYFDDDFKLSQVYVPPKSPLRKERKLKLKKSPKSKV